MLPTRQIYIDSIQQTSDCVSHTDFSVVLQVAIHLPSNTSLYITDVIVSVSFYTISADRINMLYVAIQANSNSEDDILCAKRFPGS